MKTCIICKQSKAVDQFAPHSRSKDGHAKKCLACSSHMTPSKNEKYVPARDPTLVQGNLLDKFRGTYSPGEDRAYYRNDGNKHIPSKGIRC